MKDERSGAARTEAFEEASFTTGRPYLEKGEWLWDGRARHSRYRHPQGTAEVDEYIMGKPVTSIRFTHSGMTYARRWEDSFGDKTLSRLAREFIEAVTIPNPKGEA